MDVKSKNITKVETRVPDEERWQRNKHRGGVLWFTGLSGSGKSTLAIALERHLFEQGMHVYVLDGDNVRARLNRDLGFSPEDREENIRRIGEVAALFAEAGFLVISAFISPYKADRRQARAAAGELFSEVYINADLETCERRDPKGLYKKARAGDIPEFTGISAPYELPETAELSIDTAKYSVEECVERLADYVKRTYVLKD